MFPPLVLGVLLVLWSMLPPNDGDPPLDGAPTGLQGLSQASLKARLPELLGLKEAHA